MRKHSLIFTFLIYFKSIFCHAKENGYTIKEANIGSSEIVIYPDEPAIQNNDHTYHKHKLKRSKLQFLTYNPQGKFLKHSTKTHNTFHYHFETDGNINLTPFTCHFAGRLTFVRLLSKTHLVAKISSKIPDFFNQSVFRKKSTIKPVIASSSRILSLLQIRAYFRLLTNSDAVS